MTLPLPAPAERFATLLAWLSQAVMAMSGGDRLALKLIGQIIDRIRGIKQGVARIVARLHEGSYSFRKIAPHARRTDRPRQPNPLPLTHGWLLKLVPQSVGSRSQLEYLFRDPEMMALLAAAPGSFGPPLRSLCRMLGVPTPAILAAPKKTRPPRKVPAATPEAKPPKPKPAPPRLEPPEWMRGQRSNLRLPGGIRSGPNRARGG